MVWKVLTLIQSDQECAICKTFARRIFRPSHLSLLNIYLIAFTLNAQGTTEAPANQNLAEKDRVHVVDLKLRTDSTSAIQGELHLGEVKAGAKHTIDFCLRNLEDRSLKFNKVKPSCKCVDVSIPACELMASDTSSRCSLTVSIPSVRGKKVQVAEFVLSNMEDASMSPVTVGIFASISRPVYLVPRSGMISVGEDQTVIEKVPIEIDLDVNLNDVRIRVLPEVLKAELIRAGTTSSQCEIVLTGARDSILESKYLNLEVSYEKKPDWEIRDTLAMTFYDGTLLRTFPSNPTINEKGDVAFSIISKREFDAKLVRMSDGKGEYFDISVQRRSKSVVEIRARLPTGHREAIVHLNDKNLTELPVTFDDNN